jgi:hypothetical protein
MAYNTCSPARIYGPLPQTLFLGCSVLSFSATIGWNGQASNLTVELVQDTCEGPRVWWDNNLQRQTSTNMADPGFIIPEPGCMVYFRMEEDSDETTEAARGGFEYAGIIQSWNEKYDAQGNPVYTVKITDARAILSNSQVIVNGHSGTTAGVWNLLNVYGFVEALGSVICNATYSGTMGGFTSDNAIGNIANDRGIVWNDVKCALSTMLSSTNRALANTTFGQFVRDARLMFSGPTTGNDGYGIPKKDGTITDPLFTTLPYVNLNFHEYLLDLTEIPFTPSFYRVKENDSVMNIISQVCEDAGCDYYIELLPFIVLGNIYKVIKIRTALRSNQPQLGRLDDFIAAKQAQVAGGGGIISYTKGEELRNEDTAVFLMAGQEQRGVTSFTNIEPFWGYDQDGELITHTVDANDEYVVNYDVRKLNESLNTPFGANFIGISERELRAIQTGSVLDWITTSIIADLGIKTQFDALSVFQNMNTRILQEVIQGTRPMPALALPRSVQSEAQGADSTTSNDVDKIFKEIKEFADTYYGVQFLFNPNLVCRALDVESGRYRYSHSPEQKCWIPDSTITFIGLTHNGAAANFFRDEEGSYEAIIKFDLANSTNLAGVGSYTADATRLSGDEYIVEAATSSLWTKAEVFDQWIRGTPSDPDGSSLNFLVRLSNPVTSITSDTNALASAFNTLDSALVNATMTAGSFRSIDRGPVAMQGIAKAVKPSAAMLPIRYNQNIYGPFGVVGLPGQVRLDDDPNMRPWKYGSDTIMRSAANEKVGSATNMRKGERGSITLAGFPNIPLGAELMSVDAGSPPVSQGAQKYLATRTYNVQQCGAYNTSFYTVPMNGWTGEFGPNITQVDVSVGPNGFTTSYIFSTYTPQFGRFNKENAERLQALGTQRLSVSRFFRGT